MNQRYYNEDEIYNKLVITSKNMSDISNENSTKLKRYLMSVKNIKSIFGENYNLVN